MNIKDVFMLRIEENTILVKTMFGCFFMNKQGAQIQDPDTHDMKVREDSLYERYAFLNKKEEKTPEMYRRAKIIVERIASGFKRT